jgi:tripartite-type tricarboxylate transporter receptor subunit TctC
VAAARSGSASAADTYPVRPVKLVVGYTPGGFTDGMARVISDKLAQALGQPVVIENKPGANSMVGAGFVAKSSPDGYTLAVVIPAHAANATLHAGRIPFDAFKDFAPICVIGVAPLILVANNDFPPKNVSELVSYARAHPGKVNYGSSGVGANAHLAMEQFALVNGIRMQHVPYKGTAPALSDLIGGQIDVMFDTPVTMLSQVVAGKIRGLAMASETRTSFAPQIPTVIEGGVPGFVWGTWAMLLAPANTPSAIIDRLSAEVAKIVRTDEMRAKFGSLGVEGVGNSSLEATAFLRNEIERNGKIIRDAKITVQD